MRAWEAARVGQAYDAPFSLPAIAPRPLLIANGELDPRCPMRGVHAALPAAQTVLPVAETLHSPVLSCPVLSAREP